MKPSISCVLCLAIGLVLALGGCGRDAGGEPARREPAGQPTAAMKGGLKTVEPSSDYPLERCVVSGEPLDAMGGPIAVEHDGVQVQFCCEGCLDDFKEDPAKFVAKVKAASER